MQSLPCLVKDQPGPAEERTAIHTMLVIFDNTRPSSVHHIKPGIQTQWGEALWLWILGIGQMSELSYADPSPSYQARTRRSQQESLTSAASRAPRAPACREPGPTPSPPRCTAGASPRTTQSSWRWSSQKGFIPKLQRYIPNSGYFQGFHQGPYLGKKWL